MLNSGYRYKFQTNPTLTCANHYSTSLRIGTMMGYQPSGQASYTDFPADDGVMFYDPWGGCDNGYLCDNGGTA